MNIEQEILEIRQRNSRVEQDKAWETSWVRKLFIAAVTYVFAVAWLFAINESSLWWKAAVPVVGYLLSTMSLSYVKSWWQENRRN